jgi:hypothetical protein
VIDDFRSGRVYSARRTHRLGGRRRDKGHHAEVRAFLDGVSAGRSGFSDGALDAMLATFAALDAASTGARVRVPRL